MGNTSDASLDNGQLRVILPAALRFYFSTDAEPDAANCSGYCNPTDEALFELDTMAANTTQMITINAAVAAGLDIGTLIVTPVRVTATQLKDTIDLQHVTAVGN